MYKLENINISSPLFCWWVILHITSAMEIFKTGVCKFECILKILGAMYGSGEFTWKWRLFCILDLISPFFSTPPPPQIREHFQALKKWVNKRVAKHYSYNFMVHGENINIYLSEDLLGLGPRVWTFCVRNTQIKRK